MPKKSRRLSGIRKSDALHATLPGLNAASFVTSSARKKFRRLTETTRKSDALRAYAFAGLVLVPTGPLKTQFQSAANAAERIGFSRQSEPEAFFEYVTETLREVFQVSDAVISKRLRSENLDR